VLCVDCPSVTQCIADLRRATRDTKKKLALARRSKMLSQLGFSQSVKEPRMLVATAQLQGLDQLEVIFFLLFCALFNLASFLF
jgi:membrane glycosyltransferase